MKRKEHRHVSKWAETYMDTSGNRVERQFLPSRMPSEGFMEESISKYQYNRWQKLTIPLLLAVYQLSQLSF